MRAFDLTVSRLTANQAIAGTTTHIDNLNLGGFAAAGNTRDPRMQALAAANTGLAGYNAYSAVQAGQGTTIGGKANQIPVLNDKGEVSGYRDATAADKLGGIGINLSLGSSKSQSNTTQTSDTAAVSNLAAGRDIRIEASGAGQNSDLTLQGTNATAARDIHLAAADEIKLLAARNTAEQHSTHQNSSASVGIGFMVGGTQTGFTIQAGASSGRGNADGSDLTHTTTKVGAGGTATLASGGDTALRGATVAAPHIVAEAGGDLTIVYRLRLSAKGKGARLQWHYLNTASILSFCLINGFLSS